MRIAPNDDVKADSTALCRPAKSVHVAFKAAVLTENIETSVTNRSRPYPGLPLVIASKFCSLNHLIRAKKRPNTVNRDTENTQHDKSRHNTCQQQILLSAPASRVGQIQYNGSRQMVAGLLRILKWVQMLIILFIITRVG